MSAFLLIIAICFVGAAVICIAGALRAVFCAGNAVDAWEHQKRIAEIAYVIERDADAPVKVKKRIAFLADSVFDRHLHREVLKRAMRSDRTEPRTILELDRQIKSEYGEHYGQLVIEALSAMAFVTILSSPWLGFMYRMVKSDVQRLRSMRQSKIRTIQSTLKESVVSEDIDVAPSIVWAAP